LHEDHGKIAGTQRGTPSMSPEQIAGSIKDNLSSITGIPAASIADQASFREDLGLDSLSLLELVVHLEYSFKLKVPEQDFASLRSVADTAGYIHQRLRPSA
jgi:acyl carrier protein